MTYIEKDFPIERLNEIALKEANAKKPIYQIHKWWARRLGSVFRMMILTSFLDEDITEDELWRKFYSRVDLGGKIILDPFMGGGTTVVEGLRLGCKVIGIDIHPVAWFVTKKEVEPVDLKELDKAFKKLEEAVVDKIDSYYKTTCPNCYREADVMYVFWAKKVKCINCSKEVELFNNFRIASKKNSDFVFCPSCKEILEVKDYREESWCPRCDANFIPAKGYVERGNYTCSKCGQKGEILKAVRREGKIPEMEMYAIEYYCANRSCGRGYKKADEEDKKLFEQAKKEFEEKKDKLLFPRQKIPDGYNTKQAKNFLYEYFYQMFNDRQLLCLSTLLEEILRIEDENVREFMVLTFSDCINANNMFCKYNVGAQKIEPLFGHHAYWPPNTPMENNVWGTKFGRGTFQGYFEKTKRAKKFCTEPYEIQVKGNEVEKLHIGDEVKGKLASEFENIESEDSNLILKAQTSEDLLFIPDKSVDAVITDPPYYDNVMYSEIADFFYIWQRLALKDNHEYFEAEYSPRAREIIKNEAQDKNDDFFIRGLTNVFRECNRALKDDGALAFTFHHAKTSAWASSLKAILDANFYISSVYPIRSEPRVGVHGGGIRYDVIIVCKKRSEDGKPASWEKVKDEIYSRAQGILENFWRSGRDISDADLFVIAMGKCLESYSKYYPNIVKNGKEIKVEEAIDDIEDIVESLIKVRDARMLPQGVDEESRLYISYIVEKEEMSFDYLHKRLSKGGFDIDYFFKENLLEKSGSMLRVVKPEERKKLLEDKRRKNKEMKIIDKIHYLHSVYGEGKPIAKYMQEWGDENLKKACELLYKKTGDETYAKIAGIVEITPVKRQIKTTLNHFVGDEK